MTSRPTSDPGPTTPPARRLGAGRRDLRLALGVALVLGSVVLGSRLLASADDRVPVWAVRTALAAGTTLAEGDLVATGVRADDLAAYVPASEPVVGRRLAHDLAPGELVPVAALVDGASATRRLVTVAVDPLHAPPGLVRGERVDVYVSPRDGASTGAGVHVLPTLVLAKALVADPGAVDPAGSSSQVGVVLDVPSDLADDAVAAARGGEVDLVRVGGGA